MPVIIRFGSGLGNQLFQFAAGYVLSKMYDSKLVADTLSFTPHFNKNEGRVTFRSFELKDLDFPMTYRKLNKGFLTRLRGYSRFRNLILDGTRSVYDSTKGFSSSFYSLGGNCVLTGYFQDRRYLEGNENQIAGIVLDRLMGKFHQPDRIPCAIHVRRGDYLKHPEFFPQEFEAYYKSCITKLEAVLGFKKIHVFSDDIKWCRKNLSASHASLHFEEPDNRLGGAFDLYRMSNADVLCIANSTFSWWAGFLGEVQGCEVIAPPMWSTWCSRPAETLYPRSWKVSERHLACDVGRSGL